MRNFRQSQRVQDLSQQDQTDVLKAVGTAAGTLLGIIAVWGKLSALARALCCFCRDFAALPRRARETHQIVIGHEAMLELYLSASSTASFHCDGYGRVVKSSREFERISSLGDVCLQSKAWRDLFLREERSEIDRLWSEAVGAGIEFTYDGHMQAVEKAKLRKVRVKAVPLAINDTGSLWFGIIREA